MRWQDVMHMVLSPDTMSGLFVMTRRAMDQELPVAKRIAMAFLGALPSAVLAVPAAIFGAYQAVDSRFDLIEREQITLRGTIEARTTLRESQMAQFQTQCAEVQRHMGSMEQRMNGVEIAISKLQALEDVRHGGK